jgi:hypothetical protein
MVSSKATLKAQIHFSLQANDQLKVSCKINAHLYISLEFDEQDARLV